MEDKDLSDALKTRASYHRAPAALRTQLLAALRGTEAPRGNRGPAAPGVGRWGWLSLGASFAFGLVLAFGVTLGLSGGPAWLAAEGARAGELTGQVVAGHVRSLMAAHLTDVGSTDQHTVKPWFNGKLDFSPPVTDLAAQGFPLTGGRLDYLERRPVAALVYKRRAHPINLFIWPDQHADQAVQFTSEQGYHVLQWRRAGMRFAAVSDVNEDELKTFVEAYRQHTAAD
jgi:anti-sigma factor RsiW